MAPRFGKETLVTNGIAVRTSARRSRTLPEPIMLGRAWAVSLTATVSVNSRWKLLVSRFRVATVPVVLSVRVKVAVAVC